MKHLHAILLAASLALGSPLALATDKCRAGPRSEWKPQTELEIKLGAEGWKIKRVKIEDGCYEVYGTDGDGRKAETFFHPKTFERVAG